MTVGILRLPRRLGLLASGLVLKKAMDYLFDYGVYPVALLAFGTVAGGLLMTAISVVMNILVIRAYDWARMDFLFLEGLKEFRSCETGPWWRRKLARLQRAGDLPAFVLLSWFEDPVVVTLYLRRGSHLYNGFARRDWIVFAGSSVLANLFWTLNLTSVMALLWWIWSLIP
jgi:hypothetical protein